MPEANVIRVRLSLKGRPIKTYTFDKEVISVGRDPAADISLDNPSVSREHLRFERMPNGHYRVVDQGSANGTYLNEERVQTAYVYNNDVVRIGKFSLWISLERDRRVERTEPERKVPAELAQGTMILSPEEINRLMSLAREKETVPPEPEPVRVTSPVSTSSPEEESRARIRLLLAVGVALVLATSVGFGAAWLFLR